MALTAAAAVAAPADVATNGVFEGASAIVISNDKLALTILKQGSTFASLVLAADGGKLNPLWDPVRMARELGRTAPTTGSLGHFVCVDGFGPVSPEERAARMPGHGEAHVRTFEYRSNRSEHAAEVTLAAVLPIVQERFTRTVRIVDSESVIYVESQLENLMGFDRPINWAEHATIGSPFLEAGVTVVDLSGRRSHTRPYPQPTSPSPAQTDRRLVADRDFTWPSAPGLDGRPVDMRGTPENPHFLDHATTVTDPACETAWVTALNPKRRLMLGYLFRRADYPWLQTWGNYPPTLKMSRGLEFSTQPFDVSRREAVGTSRMFDTPTYRWLPAKGKIETRFLMFYTQVPEGFTKVDEVRLEHHQIVIEDHAAGKRVTLAASLR